MEKIKKHLSVFWYVYVLVAILIVLIGAYGRIIELEEQNTNYIISVYHLTDVDSDEITAISYRGNENQEISFIKKEDGSWVYAPDESLVIEQAGPQYLAELLKEVTSEYQIENAEDISLYGLSEDCPYIQIVTEKKTYRIHIGNYNETVQRYYAYIEGSTTVYGLEQEIAEVLDYTLEDYLQGDFEQIHFNFNLMFFN